MHKPQSSNRRSVKHHYLPRYYLKGFVDGQGLLFVYDKREDRLLPEPLPPDVLFAENNLNTIALPTGGASDFLEDLYTKSENLFWDSLDRIARSTPDRAIELRDRMQLFLFLLILHWRLPGNADHIEQLARQLFVPDGELDFFKLKHRDGQKVPDEIKKAMRESPEFQKVARLVAPFAPFFGQDWIAALQSWRFLYAGDRGNWYFVGDNPIVTRGANDHDPKTCLAECLFPISSSLLLAASPSPVVRLRSPEAILQFNLAMLKRATRFVACGRRDWLTAVVGLYRGEVARGTNGGIIDRMFRLLECKG